MMTMTMMITMTMVMVVIIIEVIELFHYGHIQIWVKYVNYDLSKNKCKTQS